MDRSYLIMMLLFMFSACSAIVGKEAHDKIEHAKTVQMEQLEKRVTALEQNTLCQIK